VILVVGATGYLGGEICRRLRERDLDVRALVRSTSDQLKVDQLRRAGADIVEGDLRDDASLERACEGVEHVVSTATTIVSRQEGDSFGATDRDGQVRLVEAAEAAGARRFVFVSFGELPIEFPLQDAKRAVEERLRNGGLAWTILRPGLFMEVWLSPMMGFDLAAGTARILGDGDARTNWVAVPDVAAVAVATLTEDRAARTVVEVAADYASGNDIVRLVRETSGRELAVERVPAEAIEQQLHGAEDELGRTFAALMLAAARGDPENRTSELHRWVDRPLELRDFLSATAA
jgi:NADH dehydrogenase